MRRSSRQIHVPPAKSLFLGRENISRVFHTAMTVFSDRGDIQFFYVGERSCSAIVRWMRFYHRRSLHAAGRWEILSLKLSAVLNMPKIPRTGPIVFREKR